jgi:hypothetical protein
MSTPDLAHAQALKGAVASEPLYYFASIDDLFESAAKKAGGVVDRNYSIGGFNVRLRFAGTALVKSMTRALDHLAVNETSTPALTVHIWDTASTGQRMAPPPWEGEAFLARGVIQGYNDARFYTAFQHGSSAVNLLDLQRNLAIFWVPSANEIPYWESGSPLKMILHWWLLSNQRQLVHGAAIGNANGGVLIVGKGGSGKSTTALASLDSDLLYLGDDYALLALDSGPVVYSLYNSAKLNSDHVRRFPQLLPRISNPDRLGEEKALLFINEHYRAKIATQLPVKAILLPQVTGLPDTRVKRISTAAGLVGLAPSTIFQLPRAGKESFRFLATVASGVPCFCLELGTDLQGIPSAIVQLLSDLPND